MPSKSKKQAKTMTAACKNKKFRKKVNIPKKVACDFHKADKGNYHESVIDEAKFLNVRAAWITDDNVVHPVGQIGAHLDWAIQHFNLQSSDPEDDWMAYEMAFAHGYVRFRIMGGYIDVEGTKKALRRSATVWKNYIRGRKIYLTVADEFRQHYELSNLNHISKILEAVQLNELREYLGLEDEYGGWITKDKKIHTVKNAEHFIWVEEEYGPRDIGQHKYERAFNDGAIRYVTDGSGLYLQGNEEDIRNLFRIWWPSVINSTFLSVDIFRGNFENYILSSQKNELLGKWKPKLKEAIQLNELREYLGLEDEYGGWITKDKKIYTVGHQLHYDWVEKQYGERDYFLAFQDGALRYQLGREELNISGSNEAIKYLFRIWWPTALAVEKVNITVRDMETRGYDEVTYNLPEDKIKLMTDFKPVLVRKQQTEAVQLNELHEYLGLKDEYGGFITKDKQVHTVPREGHTDWILKIYFDDDNEEYMDWAQVNDYNWYQLAFNDGAVRYTLSRGSLYLEGNAEDIKKLFRVWWPTAINSSQVMIDGGPNSGTYDIPADKSKLRKNFGVSGRTPKYVKEQQLNELRQYLNLENEYGGWITKDKKVHTIEFAGHIDWVAKNYNGARLYWVAFRNNAVRYIISRAPKLQELSLHGRESDIRNLFRIWWPTAIEGTRVSVDLVDEDDPSIRLTTFSTQYVLPEDKAKLMHDFKPTPQRRVESLDEELEFPGSNEEYGGWITADKQIHQVSSEGHIGWIKDQYNYDSNSRGDPYDLAYEDGAVRYISKIRKGILYLQGDNGSIQRLFRVWWPSLSSYEKIIIGNAFYDWPKDKNKIMKKWGPESSIEEDTLGQGIRSRGHFENDPEADPHAKARFKNAVKKVFSTDETAGGTVGHMYGGGYAAGMKSTVTKKPKKKKAVSPIGSIKVSEKYNTTSTFLNVGKNIVELRMHTVTRRIKKGNAVEIKEIPSHRIFVDGFEVGFVDQINDRYYVKTDDTYESFNTIEEAVAKAMGATYYDGKGDGQFQVYDPDPNASTPSV